jgi:hypothetical protein
VKSGTKIDLQQARPHGAASNEVKPRYRRESSETQGQRRVLCRAWLAASMIVNDAFVGNRGRIRVASYRT